MKISTWRPFENGVRRVGIERWALWPTRKTICFDFWWISIRVDL
jgi:hypothetical protein